MAEMENSKDLISVLWSGADILRSKMDANEYKNYLLGIIFYPVIWWIVWICGNDHCSTHICSYLQNHVLIY